MKRTIQTNPLFVLVVLIGCVILGPAMFEAVVHANPGPLALEAVGLVLGVLFSGFWKGSRQ